MYHLLRLILLPMKLHKFPKEPADLVSKHVLFTLNLAENCSIFDRIGMAIIKCGWISIEVMEPGLL